MKGTVVKLTHTEKRPLSQFPLQALRRMHEGTGRVGDVAVHMLGLPPVCATLPFLSHLHIDHKDLQGDSAGMLPLIRSLTTGDSNLIQLNAVTMSLQNFVWYRRRQQTDECCVWCVHMPPAKVQVS